ncbi:glycosyltransferase [uncultured Chryseobacterium sp.]|uniref:glycosyltransferase n=1 Tax=uncultured Chryseobacterium sp. TaxID=259322 RepID=UPI0026265C8C|nr:glycosyltransferase [uncultured Chryseobacterium sp.]
MKTSVALCTYNGAKYIAEQLDSILQQSIPVDEIVVCDDGSTDGTMQILQKYHAEFPNIFKIHQNVQTLRVIKNFEKAIHLSSGDVIFLCDQDDVWFPNKVKTVLRYFSANPDMEAVFHNLELYQDGAKIDLTVWESLSFDPAHFQNKDLKRILLLIGNIVTGAALAFRKQNKNILFNDAGKFYLHDYQLALYFSLRNKIGIIKNTLGIYRLHNEQQVGVGTIKSEHREYLMNLVMKTMDYPALFRHYKSINLDKWGSFLVPESESTISEEINSELEIDIQNFLRTLSKIEKLKTLMHWKIKNSRPTCI